MKFRKRRMLIHDPGGGFAEDNQAHHQRFLREHSGQEIFLAHAFVESACCRRGLPNVTAIVGQAAWAHTGCASACTLTRILNGRSAGGDKSTRTPSVGTVLMQRIGHRRSKDIDLFVPDPQYLGYLNPRLSDVAERITADDEENAEFIKLFLPAGEIDIVVGIVLQTLARRVVSARYV